MLSGSCREQSHRQHFIEFISSSLREQVTEGHRVLQLTINLDDHLSFAGSPTILTRQNNTLEQNGTDGNFTGTYSPR